MLQCFDESSRRVGLAMNLNKTKAIFNEQVISGPTYLHGTPLEVVQEYIYLRQIIQLGKNNFEGEADRRIQLG